LQGLRREPVAISVRKSKVCEPCWRKPISSLMECIVIPPRKRRFPSLNAKAFRRAMTKVLIASFFAPRGDNEEDRELEGVSNVMRL